MMDLKTFVYQPAFDALESKNVFSWKSKGVYSSELKLLRTAFLNGMKLPAYRIGIKLDKDLSAVEQNSYLSKIVNVYITYDLDDWPKNPINNFNFKSCLLEQLI